MTEVSRQPERQVRPLRWRLLLGEAAADELDAPLSREEQKMDAALAALYDAGDEDDPGARRTGGLGSSAPRVARWLGDIRTYFPTSVVQVMQRDAIERLHLVSMLMEPELLDSIQPDVHLVSSLVSLSHVMPDSTKRTARVVVGQVVAEIERRIANKTRAAVTGAVRRASRTHRPRPRDIDWNSTIRRNLDHYVPEQRTIIPQRLVGYGRGANAIVKEVVVAIDQSGSMAESVVYAAVFGATLASIRSVKTSVVAFDTEIADLTEKLSDPVDVLFGCQLGGGTDINRALAYCQQLITRPTESILVLISIFTRAGQLRRCCAGLPSCCELGSQLWCFLRCRIPVRRRTTTRTLRGWLRSACLPSRVRQTFFQTCWPLRSVKATSVSGPQRLPARPRHPAEPSRRGLPSAVRGSAP
jgi:hypothetical protein